MRRAVVPHVLVDHELVATLEHVEEGDRTVCAGHDDRTVDLDHRQPTPGGGDRVAFMGVRLLAYEQLVARRPARWPGRRREDCRAWWSSCPRLSRPAFADPGESVVQTTRPVETHRCNCLSYRRRLHQIGDMDEQQLEGGIANAGRVVRVGPHVLRPASAHSDSIHAFLRAVREAGFEGASLPAGIDDDGRERLMFIEGEVPLAPYPDWSQSDAALGVRRHAAARAARRRPRLRG